MCFLEFRRKTRNPDITTLIQHSIGGSCQQNKGKKKKKSKGESIQIGKEKIRLTVFADNIITEVEKSKRSYS